MPAGPATSSAPSSRSLPGLEHQGTSTARRGRGLRLPPARRGAAANSRASPHDARSTAATRPTQPAPGRAGRRHRARRAAAAPVTPGQGQLAAGGRARLARPWREGKRSTRGAKNGPLKGQPPALPRRKAAIPDSGLFNAPRLPTSRGARSSSVRLRCRGADLHLGAMAPNRKAWCCCEASRTWPHTGHTKRTKCRYSNVRCTALDMLRDVT